MVKDGSSARRPSHSSSRPAHRKSSSRRSAPAKTRSASVGRAVPTRSSARRERDAVTRKTQASSRAAGKGALLILAIGLIAIKAFSALPSTVKTSSDRKIASPQSQSQSQPKTTTTFANSVVNSPGTAVTAGSSVSPDQVVLPRITSSATQPSTAAPSTPSTAKVSTTSSRNAATGTSLVTVRVFNGTQISGAAGKVTNQLAQLGYDVVAPSDASTQNISTTSIYYSPGFQNQAVQLASAIGLGSSAIKPLSYSAPIPTVQPSDLNVVLGADKAS